LPSYYDSFSGGLKDLGYVDGSNITLLARSALGVPEALPGLIEELLRENVSVIVSPGPAIRAVRDKVKSTPVVFAFSGDPVRQVLSIRWHMARRTSQDCPIWRSN
jgi:putative ABC transport system substrate-binding protein